MGSVFARSEGHRLLQTVQASDSEEEAATAIAYELDFILEPITSEEQRHALYRDIALAIRASNVVSFLVLFAAGYGWGLHTDTNPWKVGSLLSSICLVAVVVAMLHR